MRPHPTDRSAIGTALHLKAWVTACSRLVMKVPARHGTIFRTGGEPFPFWFFCLEGLSSPHALHSPYRVRTVRLTHLGTLFAVISQALPSPRHPSSSRLNHPLFPTSTLSKNQSPPFRLLSPLTIARTLCIFRTNRLSSRRSQTVRISFLADRPLVRSRPLARPCLVYTRAPDSMSLVS